MAAQSAIFDLRWTKIRSKPIDTKVIDFDEWVFKYLFQLFQYNFAVVTNGRPNYISEGATVNIYDFRASSNTSGYQYYLIINLSMGNEIHQYRFCFFVFSKYIFTAATLFFIKF